MSEQKHRQSDSPLAAMDSFRQEVNSRFFVEPQTSVSALLHYFLGAAMHLALALATESIVPVLVMALLLLGSLVMYYGLKRPNWWHYFEYVVIAVEIVALMAFFNSAYVALLVVSVVHVYQTLTVFGARRGLLLLTPFLVGILNVYGYQLNQGTEVIEPSTMMVVGLGVAVMLSSSFAESSVIGGLVQQLRSHRVVSTGASITQEAILESIGEGIVGVDDQLRVNILNRQARTMFQVGKNEIRGKKVSQLRMFSDEEGQPLPDELDPFRLAIQNSSTFHYRLSTLNKIFIPVEGQEPIQIGMSVSPIIVGERTLGAVAVMHDLIQENEVEKGKSDFVALASHHLRTPLTAVKWQLERLRRKDMTNFTHKQASIIESLESANERILRLVNNLLSISRYETGTIVISRRDVDPVKMLQTVQDEFSDARQRSSATFNATVEGKVPVLKGSDEYIVKLAFGNVLENALHYTPNGSITTELKTVAPARYMQTIGGQQLRVDKGGVLFTVADTGIGIPVDQKKKIFTKLFRADNARTVYADGTGLGLHIAQQLLSLIGGKIWFESREDVGTTFYVFLPLEAAATTSSETKPPTDEPILPESDDPQ